MPHAAEPAGGEVNASLTRWKMAIDAAGAGACALVVGALIFAGLLPLERRQSLAAAQRQQLISRQQRLCSARASVKALEHELRKKEAELAGNPVHLEDASAVNRRLARINDLAASRGLEVLGVEPGEITRNARYQAVALKLTGAGEYGGCVRFLHELHEAMPDTTVVAFRLTSTPQEHATPAAFSFELRWYAAPVQATASADEDGATR